MSNNTTPPVINEIRQCIKLKGRFFKEVPMLLQHDGKELTLPMVVLNGAEMEEVEQNTYADTLKAFKGKPPKDDEPSNWHQLMEANRAYWTIYFSVRMPEKLQEKFFITKTQVQDTYTSDEAGIIASHYLEVQLNQPHLINLAEDDENVFQAVLDRIKKQGENSNFFTNGLTTASANRLIKYLVKKLESLQTTNG